MKHSLFCSAKSVHYNDRLPSSMNRLILSLLFDSTSAGGRGRRSWKFASRYWCSPLPLPLWFHIISSSSTLPRRSITCCHGNGVSRFCARKMTRDRVSTLCVSRLVVVFSRRCPVKSRPTVSTIVISSFRSITHRHVNYSPDCESSGALAFVSNWNDWNTSMLWFNKR